MQIIMNKKNKSDNYKADNNKSKNEEDPKAEQQ